MISSSSFNTETQTYPLKMNTISSFGHFTHGGVTYTGSNIACQGEKLRLKQGILNDSMMKKDYYLIDIHHVELMVVDGFVIIPNTQTELGNINTEHAQYGIQSIVWTDPKIECNLLKIMEINLQSIRPNVWHSNQRKIELTALDSFYDEKCKIKLIKTTSTNIFLTQQKVTKIENVDIDNTEISVNLAMQFQYINSRMFNDMEKNFYEYHPICNKIKMLEETTERIDKNTFARNLGDLTVTFQCKETIVAPVSDNQCYSMLKVQELNGMTWHLDSDNRILSKTALHIPCSAPFIPIYKTVKGEYVTFRPDRKNINDVHNIPTSNRTDPDSPHGLYPDALVRQWLSHSYIQHFSNLAYTFITNAFCQNEKCKQEITHSSDLSSMIIDSLGKASTIPSPLSFLGLDFEEIGRTSSIIVVFIMFFYTILSIISWFIRMLLLKDNSIKLCTLLCRASFPSVFLIAKATETKNKTTA